MKVKLHLHVWWKLKEVHPHVEVHLLFTEDVQLFIWIHGYQ